MVTALAITLELPVVEAQRNRITTMVKVERVLEVLVLTEAAA